MIAFDAAVATFKPRPSYAFPILTSVDQIRANAPVVLNITNYVAMDLTANALLSLGASPVMAHAPQELEEMVQIAGAVVLNMGTLDASWVNSLLTATKIAGKARKPVVLDPVGAGASEYRTRTARALIETGAVTAVRGNGSEILALFGGLVGTKGVESSAPSSDAAEVARQASAQWGITITVSGETDFIFGKGRSAVCRNGSPWMTRVTAMGCTASALMGAFLAVNNSPFEGAVSTMAVMGLCGEAAAKKASGPGSFRMGFLDALHGFSENSLGDLRVALQ